MTIRKHHVLLLIILLVVSMTSQAAFAYGMACRGTLTCCCTGPAASMDMTGAMPDGMDQNCCTTTANPCDIETTSPAAAKPFLAGFVTVSVDHDMAAGLMVFIADPGDVALHMARQSQTSTDRGGPPIYLQTQTFLC